MRVCWCGMCAVISKIRPWAMNLHVSGSSKRRGVGVFLRVGTFL